MPPWSKRPLFALPSLGPRAGGEQIYSKQPAELAQRLGQGKARRLCLAHGNKIYLLRPHIIPGDRRATLWLAGLQKPDPALVPALGAEDLASHPALAARLAELDKLRDQAWDRHQRRSQERTSTHQPGSQAAPDHRAAARSWSEMEQRVRASHDWNKRAGRQGPDQSLL